MAEAMSILFTITEDARGRASDVGPPGDGGESSIGPRSCFLKDGKPGGTGCVERGESAPA